MPRQRWDALVRGEGCPLCAAVASDVAVDEHGATVADLGISRLRLASNQFVHGYSVLICHTHAREPYELDPADAARYFDDLVQAGRALEHVLQPAKMNFEILGNEVPHLHCHLIPRYYGDPAPGRPIDPWEKTVRLPEEEAEELVRALRSAL
jgi:diadenosine tetraphosphate (Ap4A) HIT family hydrolase